MFRNATAQEVHICRLAYHAITRHAVSLFVRNWVLSPTYVKIEVTLSDEWKIIVPEASAILSAIAFVPEAFQQLHLTMNI